MAVSRSFSPLTSHLSPVWTEGVVREVLPNGLTLLVQPDHSAPVVSVVTHVKAGFFDEPDRWTGISHVLEHMFFKGTASRGVGAIARETKAAGGYLNAGTGYDHTSYFTVLPASGLAAALDIDDRDVDRRIREIPRARWPTRRCTSLCSTVTASGVGESGARNSSPGSPGMISGPTIAHDTCPSGPSWQSPARWIPTMHSSWPPVSAAGLSVIFTLTV